MTYESIPKPTTTYSSISELFNYLLINSTDFFLINETERFKLGISGAGSSVYQTIGKPETTYSSIVKPT